MWKSIAFCLCIALQLCIQALYCQTPETSSPLSSAEKTIEMPGRFLSRLQRSMASMDKRLTRQSEKLLVKMTQQEEKMRNQLRITDSIGAQQIFGTSAKGYAALGQKLQQDTGGANIPMSGEYLPYIDSLQSSLSFLKDHPELAKSAEAQKTLAQFQQLQAKMQDADQIRCYLKERRQHIGDYISQHTNTAKLLGSEYQDMNKELFYYSDQLRQYKNLLNNPDDLAKKALAILNKLPAFQAFMKNNSQLAGLFNIPGNYGSPESLAGLQTRDQVSALISNQVGGAGGQAALQSSVDAGRSQLDGYKDKLDKLGSGSGDIDMPGFTPNNQKTKTFWKRLEYGTNFQTTKNNYYFPTTSDLGFSVGYKINNNSTAGIGVSYKLGWGNGINDIHLSSQGLGLRSYIDLKLKGSFFGSGGLELNHAQPFASVQQLRKIDSWTQSGLIGISKIVSMKSRMFKKTKLQLLWDFLSYQQVPRTQPILFRVGYQF